MEAHTWLNGNPCISQRKFERIRENDVVKIKDVNKCGSSVCWTLDDCGKSERPEERLASRLEDSSLRTSALKRVSHRT